MELFRIVMSVASFVAGVYLIVDLFSYGFDMYVFAGVIAAFYIAHLIWPKNRKKDDADDGLWILDIIEFVVELPYQGVGLLFRGIGRVFRSSGGIDFDL
ncbi:Uncharacterised protein [BD1-7 clade bacterium]|uniref:Uncharacterized protein n=1 Tax=BD1-7 clade bacterium TaxID=2029982 RepID=A0A5S9N5V2_9GAMM|nr:Uncharacterised protein [BD1-7 clade bacterium]